jgi:hypothetical protein
MNDELPHTSSVTNVMLYLIEPSNYNLCSHKHNLKSYLKTTTKNTRESLTCLAFFVALRGFKVVKRSYLRFYAEDLHAVIFDMQELPAVRCREVLDHF